MAVQKLPLSIALVDTNGAIPWNACVDDELAPREGRGLQMQQRLLAGARLAARDHAPDRHSVQWRDSSSAGWAGAALEVRGSDVETSHAAGQRRQPAAARESSQLDMRCWNGHFHQWMSSQGRRDIPAEDSLDDVHEPVRDCPADAGLQARASDESKPSDSPLPRCSLVPSQRVTAAAERVSRCARRSADEIIRLTCCRPRLEYRRCLC